ncbi:MAG: ATP-dependent DNA helicase PcrA [Chloroflexi bacterium]|nr:ATP-dependent DNA helicase PcrA [Chloroflexota bacterium]|tara:strand:- start:12836 stop:15070 length:2235 start_codon:yes stop_codon:yes gene_type:complete
MADLNHKILDGLSEKQQTAVTHPLKPLLIVAGPGSGKTRVMSHRIPWIVNNFNVNPYEILAVTFTNKAAKELMDRTRVFLPNTSNAVVKTFHGFASYFLRIEGHFDGLDRAFSIYDDTDQLRVIKNIFEELDLNVKKNNPKVVISEISKSKNLDITPSLYSKKANSYFEEIVSRVYLRYNEILSNSNSCDFDDLLLKTKNILLDNIDVRDKWSNKYKQVIIDEFQDTNPLQFQISNLLTNNEKSISVVGDPDQSIYSWRHAVPTNILEFKKSYKDCLVVNLDESYRSTQPILEAADSIISNNSNRFKRKLWTKNKDGNLIKYNSYSDEEEEAVSVASQLSKLTETNDSANDCAIMYRVNAQSRVFEVALNSLGLKYRLIGGVRFYDRKEIKDILAYCKILINPNDDSAFERIINCPPRGIGLRTVNKISLEKNITNKSYISFIEDCMNNENEFLPKRSLDAIREFMNLYKKLITQLSIQEPHELINTIISITNYDDYLKNDEDGVERLENINELKYSAEEFSASSDSDNSEALIEFIENSSLNSNVDSINEDEESITLITLHQAKGLEYKNVFIVGMEEGLLPHSRSMESEEELEEERRLCYVGITRAKENLFLSSSNRRRFQGIYDNAIQSRFLDEIPSKNLIKKSKYKKYDESWKKTFEKKQNQSNFKDTEIVEVDFSLGDKVTHTHFGTGKLISYRVLANDIELAIRFSSPYGMKKILKEKAPITISSPEETKDLEDYYGI